MSVGEMYRKHPKWIKLILIRKVTDIAAIGTEAKNAAKRFVDAFKGVPRYVRLLRLGVPFEYWF